jgi:HK97 family phage major capsid protein
MSSWTEIKKSIDETATAFEEFKKANDARLVALKEGNESKAKELDEKITKIDGVIVKFTTLKKDIEIELESQKSRIEELEARGKQPGKSAKEKRGDDYKGVFCNWIRNRGMSPEDESKMQGLQRQMIEAKDITIGSAAGGGYAVPEEISRQIEGLQGTRLHSWREFRLGR